MMKNVLVFAFVVVMCCINGALWGIPSGLVAAALAWAVGVDPTAAGYFIGGLFFLFGFLGIAVNTVRQLEL